jgi:hypothetical protein
LAAFIDRNLMDRNNPVNRVRRLRYRLYQASFMRGTVGMAQRSKPAQQTIDHARYAPVLWVHWSKRRQMATSFEQIELRLEFGSGFHSPGPPSIFQPSNRIPPIADKGKPLPVVAPKAQRPNIEVFDALRRVPKYGRFEIIFPSSSAPSR